MNDTLHVTEGLYPKVYLDSGNSNLTFTNAYSFWEVYQPDAAKGEQFYPTEAAKF
jgi:hypothetical protein